MDQSNEKTKDEESGCSDMSAKPSPTRMQRISAHIRPLHVAAVITATMLAALVLTIAILFTHRSHSALEPLSMDAASSSIVTTTEGQYQGIPLQNGVTQWLGLRYGAAPVGDLRFAAPQPAPTHEGVIAANQLGPGCPGKGPALPFGTAEDCLWADVYAPTNATASSSLPVYVFIQGGGFDGDSAHYNGSSLIQAANFDMVTVSFTYRGAALGFLAGAEIKSNASLNNGLKDQRFLLQWVQKNIAAFGGNPKHVTVGGVSAGGGSVTQHLVAYGGRDDGLFHAALAQSQSFPAVRTVEESQYQYDNLVKRAGCDTESDTLACLRKLDIIQFQKANVNEPFPGAPGDPIFPYNPTLDPDDFVTDYPIRSFTAGKYIKVPTISGDDTDEGTIFTPSNIRTVSGTENFLRSQFPLLTAKHLAVYNELYSFNDTEAPLYWQKASTSYGETRYICPGIQLSNALSMHNNPQVWNYRYNVLAPEQTKFNLGVPHTAEIPAIWGWDANAPPSYGPGQLNGNIQRVMQGYWTSFIRTFDPSIYRAPGTPVWEEWVASKNNRIRLETNTTAMEIVGDEQKTRCEYLASIALAIAQ